MQTCRRQCGAHGSGVNDDLAARLEGARGLTSSQGHWRRGRLREAAPQQGPLEAARRRRLRRSGALRVGRQRGPRRAHPPKLLRACGRPRAAAVAQQVGHLLNDDLRLLTCKAPNNQNRFFPWGREGCGKLLHVGMVLSILLPAKTPLLLGKEPNSQAQYKGLLASDGRLSVGLLPAAFVGNSMCFIMPMY